MSKKVLLIAGVLLAAGSVAAISCPVTSAADTRHGDSGPARLLRPSSWMPTDDASLRSSRRTRLAVRGRAASRAQQGAPTDERWLRSTTTKAELRQVGAASASPCATSTTTGASATTTRAPAVRDDRPLARPIGADRARDRRGQDGRRARQDGKERQGCPAPGALHAASVLGRDDRQFSRLDKNGDGFIDAKDFEAWRRRARLRPRKRFFKRFDANGDGKVSKDEFRPLRQGSVRQPRSRRRRQDYGGGPAADDARTWYLEVRLCRIAGAGALTRHQRAGAQERVRTGPTVRARRQRGGDEPARARGGGRERGFSRPGRPASADRAGDRPAHAAGRCGGRGRGAGDVVEALAQCRGAGARPERRAAVAAAGRLQPVHRPRARPPQHDGRGGGAGAERARRARCATWPSASSAHASTRR